MRCYGKEQAKNQSRLVKRKSSGQGKDRSPKELLEKECGVWKEELGPRLEYTNASPGQRPMKDWSGQSPMLQARLRDKSSSQFSRGRKALVSFEKAGAAPPRYLRYNATFLTTTTTKKPPRCVRWLEFLFIWKIRATIPLPATNLSQGSWLTHRQQS